MTSSGGANGTGTIFNTTSSGIGHNINYNFEASKGRFPEGSLLEVYILDPIEICIVTLDTDVYKNKIVWDRPTQTDIDSFMIYREVSTDNYQLIATQDADLMTEYIDTSSHPEIQSYRYKINYKNNAGIEADLSPYHRTINVSHTGTSPITLIFNAYENEADPSFPPSYKIYRGPDYGSMTEYTSTPGGDPNYNINVVSPVANEKYYVTAEMTGDCIPTSITKVSGGPYNQSVSNIDEYSSGPSAINYIDNANISIYPNPTKGFFTVEGADIRKIIVSDINGKTIVVKDTNSDINRIDLPTNLKGVFTIKIITNNGISVKNIVVM